MDYIDYVFELKGTTPMQEGWDAKGLVTLRYGADDFLPMVQRAITQGTAEVAGGLKPIAGPYEITSLTLTAVQPMPVKAKVKS